MPDLIIIAGCNGAGKSTFASSLLPKDLSSFDYDKIFLEQYFSLPDSELRELFAKKRATSIFENSIREALLKNQSFSYETNFDSHPLVWAEKFRDKGYQLLLVFFCLENQSIARHRIQVRKEFKGHFVDNKSIDLKWRAGYKNVNANFEYFDKLLFVDNSKQNQLYSNLLQINDGKVICMTENLPDYFEHRLPDIYKLLDKK